MAGYKLGAFKGRYPGVERRLIPDNAATIARDLKLGYGDIRPLYEDENIGYELIPREGEAATVESLYRYLDAYWVHFSAATSFVAAPIGQDRWERLIFAHDDYDDTVQETIPAVYVAGIIPGEAEANEVTQDYPEVPQMPGSWMALGVPRPSVRPTATAFNTLGDVEDLRTFFYCFTVVNDRGEESAPSLPTSTGVTVNEGEFDNDGAATGHRVELTLNIDQDVESGPYNDVAGGDTTKYRSAESVYLYRLFAEDSTQTWMFVKEIAVSGATMQVIDDAPTSALPGDTLVSFDWVPPSLGVRQLRSLPNGSIVGFKGNEILFSEPWYPYAWPVKYRYAVDAKIIGIGVFGSSVAILTDSQPYLAVGAHPGEMTVTRIDADQACVSRRSIVDFGDRVVWASPDGLFSVGSNGVESVTGSFIDKRTWRASFDPDSIIATSYEGRYIASYGGEVSTGFMVNPYAPDEGLVDLTTDFTAVYRDYEDDAAYMVRGAIGSYWIYNFENGDSPREWEWRSKILEFPAHVSLGRAQVIGTDYPFEIDTHYLTDVGALQVYNDDLSVASRNAIALRAGTVATDWLVTIRGTGECEAVIIGETMKDIKGN